MGGRGVAAAGDAGGMSGRGYAPAARASRRRVHPALPAARAAVRDQPGIVACRRLRRGRTRERLSGPPSCRPAHRHERRSTPLPLQHQTEHAALWGQGLPVAEFAWLRRPPRPFGASPGEARRAAAILRDSPQPRGGGPLIIGCMKWPAPIQSPISPISPISPNAPLTQTGMGGSVPHGLSATGRARLPALRCAAADER